MDHQEFQKIFYDQVSRCEKVLVAKAAEYATEDRLHNFKVAAELGGTSLRQAVSGMMIKHTVSVYDLVRGTESDPAVWDEKITDHLNYLILLRAVLVEEAKDAGQDSLPFEDQDLGEALRAIQATKQHHQPAIRTIEI